jgi:hypothetical protein
MSGIQRITAKGTRKRARTFYKAYQKIFTKKEPPGEHYPVDCYLLCHALELGLKSLLINDGVNPEVLKKSPYGHNLDRIVDDVLERKILDIEQDTYHIILMINRIYSSKDFEYFKTGIYRLPRDFVKLESVVENIVYGD